jgi:hypothetical protein
LTSLSGTTGAQPPAWHEERAKIAIG